MEQFLKDGTIFGQTAYDIYIAIQKESGFYASTLHLKLEPVLFELMIHTNLNRKLKKITNCMLKTSIKGKTFVEDDQRSSPPLDVLGRRVSESIKLFLCKNVDINSIEPVLIKIMINTQPLQVKIENIVETTINILLEPILNLRKCKDIEEALTNWALNAVYLESPVYIDFKKLKTLNVVEIDPKYLNGKISWFLATNNIRDFVPQKFLNKIRKLHKSKKNLWVEFMEVVNDINRYFVKKVRAYHKYNHIDSMTYFYLDFPIELYGTDLAFSERRSKLLLYDPSKKVPEKPSQFMLGLAYALSGTIPKPPPPPKTYLRLRSTLIFENLRWFFNTRRNDGKAFGFNGIYGLIDGCYGQTFYKYDDVILWLVTHPNTIEEVELVVLDPIPQNYIYF